MWLTIVGHVRYVRRVILSLPRAKMVSLPVIVQPFQRVAMDVIGPLPLTQRGNRLILTICDNATHYPENIPLPSVEAPGVARELVNLFFSCWNA